MSPVKIEVNCFSLLYKAPGDSTGKLKLFHLFSDVNSTEPDRFILAYGPGVEFMTYEWMNETDNELHNKNTYDIN